MRGALYVDGFNLYHAINDLCLPHLKWLNLWKLGEVIGRGHAKTLEKAVFCTAFFPGDHGKRVRHEAYVAALALAGVETRLGHTTKEPMECARHGCGHKWDAPREKQTDINVALSIYEDACHDLYDIALIVTADTDQVATLRAVRARFPLKRTMIVFPPGRPSSKHLRDHADYTFSLTAEHIDACVFPAIVVKEGHRTILRPREYAPPPEWIHPDQRPR